MVLTIYDKTGNVRANIAANDSSTQQKEVEGDNVLTLSFTYYAHIALDVNWYTDFEGERYWLMEKYAPEEKNEGEWVYNVKLYGIESLIKRFLVLETTDGDAEPVFTLTAPAREHVAMIVKCINDGMDTTDWKVGQVDGTELITIDYEGKYCDEGLKEVAEKVGGRAEWWVDGQTVNVCRCEHGEEITLGYGKGLTGLDCETGSTAKFYTRLFPIGSKRNIDPEKYGYRRLMLPGGRKYVELHTEEYGIYDHYEEEAFSGIYPRRTGMVSSVRSVETKDEEGKTFTIYYFKDETLDFDPNDYELAEETKRVSFEDGELSGLGTSDDHYFEVNYDSGTKEFEMITIWPYDDERQLPGGQLIPRPGDHYILWNIRMPDEYYPKAEAELKAAVDDYNAEHWRDISVYKGATDHVWVEATAADLYVGRRVRLESEKYFPETGYRSSRITKITRKVNLPSQMDIEISDALQEGTLDKVSDSIGALKSYTKTKTESISIPDIIRTGDTTRATDNNLYSARRSQKEFVSKNMPDRVRGLKRFVDGVVTGEDGAYGMDGKGNIRGKKAETETVTNTGDMSTKNLTVTGKLTVFELEIERARSVGGLLIVSPADFRVDAVEKTSDGWRCYMLAEEETAGGEPRKIRQMWQPGDQAFCQSVSLDDGSSGLRYYWRAVTAVSWANVVRDDGKEYLYIELSESDIDPSSTDTPTAGDSLVLLGNHEIWDTGGNLVAEADESRQGAEVISAYRSIDPYLANKAPYKAQYWGINDYNLTGHLKTYFARGKNHIVGDIDMTTESTLGGKSLGETLDDMKKTIDAAKAQSDRQIMIWFGETMPTLTNEPYTQWADDAERSEHIGDIYYNRSKTDETAGHAYELRQDESSGEYYWDEITDSDVLYSLELASRACQESADAKRDATAAMKTVREMSDDSLLTPAEQLTLGKELGKLYYERYGKDGVVGLDMQADAAGADRTAYDTAFDELTKHLNKGEAWSGEEDDYGSLILPSMLRSGETEEIDSRTFDDLWNWLYTTRTELINNIANGHIRCFVGIPQPPYKEGDIWVNVVWPIVLQKGEERLYDNDSLVCVRSRCKGEKFDINDWRPQQEYTTRVVTKQIQTANKIASIICGEKDLDSIESLIEGTEDWKGLVSGLIGLKGSFNTYVTSMTETINLLQKAVTDSENKILNYTRAGFVQYVTDDEGGLYLFASYADAEGEPVTTAGLSLKASADGATLGINARDIVFGGDETYINGHLVIDSSGGVTLDDLRATRLSAVSGTVGGFVIDSNRLFSTKGEKSNGSEASYDPNSNDWDPHLYLDGNDGYITITDNKSVLRLTTDDITATINTVRSNTVTETTLLSNGMGAGYESGTTQNLKLQSWFRPNESYVSRVYARMNIGVEDTSGNVGYVSRVVLYTGDSTSNNERVGVRIGFVRPATGRPYFTIAGYELNGATTTAAELSRRFQLRASVVTVPTGSNRIEHRYLEVSLVPTKKTLTGVLTTKATYETLREDIAEYAGDPFKDLKNHIQLERTYLITAKSGAKTTSVISTKGFHYYFDDGDYNSQMTFSQKSTNINNNGNGLRFGSDGTMKGLYKNSDYPFDGGFFVSYSVADGNKVISASVNTVYIYGDNSGFIPIYTLPEKALIKPGHKIFFKTTSPKRIHVRSSATICPQGVAYTTGSTEVELDFNARVFVWTGSLWFMV